MSVLALGVDVQKMPGLKGRQGAMDCGDAMIQARYLCPRLEGDSVLTVVDAVMCVKCE
jgi:hypothetical protein